MSTQIFSSPFGLQCKGFWSGHLCKPVQILYATFSWVSQSGFQGFLILENGVSGFGDWSAVFPLLGWGFRISGLEVPKLPRYWTCVCGCRKQRALPQMAACLGSPIVQRMVIQAGGLFFLCAHERWNVFMTLSLFSSPFFCKALPLHIWPALTTKHWIEHLALSSWSHERLRTIPAKLRWAGHLSVLWGRSAPQHREDVASKLRALKHCLPPARLV